MNPLAHFVLHGWREGRRTSAAFDTAHYLSQHPRRPAAGKNPLTHYIEHGRLEARSATADGDEQSVIDQNRTEPFVVLKARSLGPAPVERPTVLCLSHVMPWPPRAGKRVPDLSHAALAARPGLPGSSRSSPRCRGDRVETGRRPRPRRRVFERRALRS
jgi:hypothetical protein